MLIGDTIASSQVMIAFACLGLLVVGGMLIAAVSDPAGAAAACARAAHDMGGAAPVVHAGAIAVRKMSPTDVVYPRRSEALRRARAR